MTAPIQTDIEDAIIEVPLSIDERELLDEKVKFVHQHLDTFVQVGDALIFIRDNNLYREFGTFERFVAIEFGLSRTYAYRLMGGSTVVGNVANWQQLHRLGIDPPARESTARALSVLGDEYQGPAWDWAQRLSGISQPTAQMVTNIVTKMKTESHFMHGFGRLPKSLHKKAWDVATAIYGNEICYRELRGISDAIFEEEAYNHEEVDHSVDEWLERLAPLREALAGACDDDVEDAFDDEKKASAPGKPKRAAIESGYNEEHEAKSNPTQEEPPDQDGGQVDKDFYSTPENIVELIWKVQKGGIDLDPCTHEKAQKLIKARLYYYKEHDGLGRDWSGNAWMNPPYSNPLPWVEKLLGHMVEGAVPSASALTNCDPSRQWHKKLKRAARWVADPPDRIQFWHPDPRAKTGINRNAQTLFLIGEESDFDIQPLLDAGWDVTPGGCGIGGPGPIEQLEFIRKAFGVGEHVPLHKVANCLMFQIESLGLTIDTSEWEDEEEEMDFNQLIDEYEAFAEELEVKTSPLEQTMNSINAFADSLPSGVLGPKEEEPPKKQWGFLDAYGFVQESEGRALAIEMAAESIGNYKDDRGWAGEQDRATVTVGQMSNQGEVTDPEDPTLGLVNVERIELIIWINESKRPAIRHRRPRKTDRWV